MQKYRIIRSLLPSKPVFLEDKDGRLDYIGQILQQMKVKTRDGFGKCFRTPSQLKEIIFPFTVQLRGTILDSKITIDILRLPPGKASEAELSKILATVGIELVFED